MSIKTTDKNGSCFPSTNGTNTTPYLVAWLSAFVRISRNHACTSQPSYIPLIEFYRCTITVNSQGKPACAALRKRTVRRQKICTALSKAVAIPTSRSCCITRNTANCWVTIKSAFKMVKQVFYCRVSSVGCF